MGRSSVWEVDRSGSDRLVPHLPLCAPSVPASRGAVPAPQVWHGAQREHGEEHPLQLPRHAPVHGQIQPEGGGGRHHEPEDRVSSRSTAGAVRPVASSTFSLPLRTLSPAEKLFLTCLKDFCREKKQNMYESVAQTKSDSRDACLIKNKVSKENNSPGKCNKTYIYTDRK